MNITLNAGSNTIRVQGGPGGAFSQDRICIVKESGSPTRAAIVEPMLTPATGDLQLTVYPNPNDGQFISRFYAAKNSEMTLKVIDMTGRVLTERRVTGRGEHQEERFTLLPGASGKLMVTLQQGTQRVTRSILIK